MTKRLICPENARHAADALNMSPGILSNGYLFMTGTTGSGPDGSMPSDPEAQFRSVFAKITEVLAEAGLKPNDVVEMTSYHIGLRDHFDLFDKIRQSVFDVPTPAWTAVEVAGLRREGALVEIRIVAATRRD